MEKTNGPIMTKIAAWGDSKVAAFLRDLKPEEPVQDPAPSRALCRVVFLIILLVGFSVSLGYLFWEAPDVRIKQIYNLQGKNNAYPVGKLYNNTSGQAFDPISCPCSKTSVSIADVMNVYVLYEDSPEWSIDYNASAQPPSINFPDPNTSAIALPGHVQKDPVPLTAGMFCKSTSLWPPVLNVSKAEVSQLEYMCQIATSVMFNLNSTPNYAIPLETPILLDAEALAASTFQAVQDNIVIIQSLMAMDVANPTAKMYGNAVMSFLRDVPIIYGVETDPSVAYYLGALNQLARLERLELFNNPNPTVLLFNTSKGIGFLQMYSDWPAHYNICRPEYCVETKQMGYVRRLYWALGLLGGTATIVLGVVNIVLWPFTAFVLRWLYTTHRGKFPELPCEVRSS